MFGQMNVDPLLRLQAGGSDDRSDLDGAVSALLDKTDWRAGEGGSSSPEAPFAAFDKKYF